MSQTDDSDELTRSLAWATDAGAAPRLLVFWAGGFAARALCAGKTLTIGRSDECDVRVVHPSVSRRHVAVHVGPPLTVEDLASQNGTFIGGLRLPTMKPIPLEPGKLLEAGNVVLVVHAPGRTQRSEHAATLSARASLAPSAGAPTSAAPALSAAGSGAMTRVRRLVELVAVSGLGVVLLGEKGVGKQVLAGEIHARSPRAKGPFVRVSCGAPPSALEAELFGHERGALAREPGLLEEASGGTLLLDEVAELPASTQAKLLRALEQRELSAGDGGEPRALDVRLIAATHRDLAKRVDTGAFQRDLYCRLNGISIHVPPLRERPSELDALAHGFVSEARARAGRPPLPIAFDALEALRAHAFPGNIRELKQLLERAVVLCLGAELTLEQLRFDEARANQEVP